VTTVIGIVAGAILFSLFAFAERGLRRCSRGSCGEGEAHGCTGCGTPWFRKEKDDA
jgi:hypothetical protein